ncbi:MAG: leucine-rich repeat domain-containing protein [Oscillospiraceae bacterium]|jgi:hypothetical protein|nr:leucine-rich repeat domain-containing protein [Oscillospiraceae bacterium]
MKPNRKRISAMIIAFAMVTSLFANFPAVPNNVPLKITAAMPAVVNDQETEPSSESEAVDDGDGIFYEEVENNGVFTYIVADSKATITDWAGEVSDITIPETLGGYTVTAIGEEAFKNNKTIITVDIPDSITSIGKSAFEGCTTLWVISFSENLEFTTIPAKAFYDCNSLINITLPANITTIENLAFGYCLTLENVWISAKNLDFFQKGV